MSATIVLSDAEVTVLQELLEGLGNRLLFEIAHTHHRAMRQGLRARDAVVQAILQKLGDPERAIAASAAAPSIA